MGQKEKKAGGKQERLVSTWEDFQRVIGEDYKPPVVNVDSLTHPCFTQIAKDIDRTFPTHPRYSHPQGLAEFEKTLRRVALQLGTLKV